MPDAASTSHGIGDGCLALSGLAAEGRCLRLYYLAPLGQKTGKNLTRNMDALPLCHDQLFKSFSFVELPALCRPPLILVVLSRTRSGSRCRAAIQNYRPGSWP